MHFDKRLSASNHSENLDSVCGLCRYMQKKRTHYAEWENRCAYAEKALIRMKPHNPQSYGQLYYQARACHLFPRILINQSALLVCCIEMAIVFEIGSQKLQSFQDWGQIFMMIRISNDNLICFIVMHFTFQLNTFYSNDDDWIYYWDEWCNWLLQTDTSNRSPGILMQIQTNHASH